jgi:hypothetical protein
VNVTPESAKLHMATIQRYTVAASRDPSQLFYSVTTGIGQTTTREEVSRFANIGVDRVIIGALGASANEYTRLIETNANALIA